MLTPPSFDAEAWKTTVRKDPVDQNSGSTRLRKGARNQSRRSSYRSRILAHSQGMMVLKIPAPALAVTCEANVTQPVRSAQGGPAGIVRLEPVTRNLFAADSKV